MFAAAGTLLPLLWPLCAPPCASVLCCCFLFLFCCCSDAVWPYLPAHFRERGPALLPRCVYTTCAAAAAVWSRAPISVTSNKAACNQAACCRRGAARAHAVHVPGLHACLSNAAEWWTPLLVPMCTCSCCGLRPGATTSTRDSNPASMYSWPPHWFRVHQSSAGSSTQQAELGTQ